VSHDQATPAQPDRLHGPRQLAHEHLGDNGRLLATAISWNVVFSTASGLLLAIGAFALSGWLGVDAWLLAGLGVALVAFAGVLVWLLAEPRRVVRGAQWVIGADVAWVGAAVVLLVAAPAAMSGAGRVALTMVSIVVAILALAQLVGLRRYRLGPVTATSPIELRVERLIDAPANQVWQAIADAGGYARFAPGIASTTIVAGDGEGMVRVCSDGRGGTWSETCTLWEEGRRYRMDVDVSSYPAYYRLLLHDFAQTWTIEPAAGGTHVRLVFTGAVKLGVIGRAAARLLGNRRRLEAILNNYQHELTGGPGTP
jgi:uncharacterized protein YndB with AHSA1/START domain